MQTTVRAACLLEDGSSQHCTQELRQARNKAACVEHVHGGRLLAELTACNHASALPAESSCCGTPPRTELNRSKLKKSTVMRRSRSLSVACRRSDCAQLREGELRLLMSRVGG